MKFFRQKRGRLIKTREEYPFYEPWKALDELRSKYMWDVPPYTPKRGTEFSNQDQIERYSIDYSWVIWEINNEDNQGGIK